jgi:hypothetical protein
MRLDHDVRELFYELAAGQPPTAAGVRTIAAGMTARGVPTLASLGGTRLYVRRGPGHWVAVDVLPRLRI